MDAKHDTPIPWHNEIPTFPFSIIDGNMCYRHEVPIKDPGSGFVVELINSLPAIFVTLGLGWSLFTFLLFFKVPLLYAFCGVIVPVLCFSAAFVFSRYKNNRWKYAWAKQNLYLYREYVKKLKDKEIYDRDSEMLDDSLSKQIGELDNGI